MKIVHRLLGILIAFCLMWILFITSIQAVVYWNPGYFEKEYTKYQVLDDLPPMTMEDLLDVTDEMMDYLKGDRADLHVTTTMGGETREFFNDREIAHMEDVRDLFLGAIFLRRVCLVVAVACLAVLAAIISTDFSKYFVVFHHIFFKNDLWILNPETDMLINIVPEGFFLDTAARIAGLYGALVLVLFGVSLFLSLRGRGKK